jgi:hypothetical protein
MATSLINRIRIWHLKQLSAEAWSMFFASRNPHTRGAIRSNIRDYEEKIQKLKSANLRDRRLHG